MDSWNTAHFKLLTDWSHFIKYSRIWHDAKISPGSSLKETKIDLKSSFSLELWRRMVVSAYLGIEPEAGIYGGEWMIPILKTGFHLGGASCVRIED